MAFYNMHSRDRYQQRFLRFGLILGFAVAIYLYSQNTTLNVVTTVMPTSITLSLIISALAHHIFPSHLASGEKVFRIVDKWAENMNMAVLENWGAGNGQKAQEEKPTAV
jgi:hypothetical protein